MGVDQAAAWLVFDRKLYTRNDPSGTPFQAAKRVNPGYRVVVGQRDGAEARGGMGVDHCRRLELAVAEDRVQVQVRPPVGYVNQCWQML